MMPHDPRVSDWLGELEAAHQDADTLTESANAPAGFAGSAPAVGKPSLVPVTLREANDFVEAFHRHNGRTVRNGGKYAVGAAVGGVLAGVAIVGNPLSATFMDGVTAEVLRLCTNGDAPRGTCSMLYQACWRAWRAMGGQRMITYTLPSEGGASLRGAGWKVVGQTKPVAKGWRKRDHLDSAREWQPIMGQIKLRWEAQNARISDGEEPAK